MKAKIWLIVASVLAGYFGAIGLFGFADNVALGVHFSRVAVAVAVLILYIPALATIFNEVPPPRRDYLLAGIVLSWLSAVCFSFWNEAGRVFGVDTSIFTSPIAGLFSLFLVMAGCFHLVAPYASSGRRRIVALVVGVILSAALVFVAPLFR